MGICDFLELDPRPTFALKLESDFDAAFDPVFINQALRSDPSLRSSLPLRPASYLSRPSKSGLTNFQQWVKSIARGEGTAPSFLHSGILWTTFRVKRWVIISGGHLINEPAQIQSPGQAWHDEPARAPSARWTEPHSKNDEFPRLRRALTSPDAENAGTLLDRKPSTVDAAFVTPGTPDWTLPHPEGDLSPHIIFVRSIDWGVTPLGDMKTWSREFRQIACLVMASPFPVALFWGAELTVMYNKAYADTVAGLKHPGLMGTGFRGPSAELWNDVGKSIDECQRTGKSVAMYEQMLPIERHGFVEETYYTVSRSFCGSNSGCTEA